jgi:proteasome beta subunit
LRIGGSYQGSSFTELLEVDYGHLRPDLTRLSDGLDSSAIPHGTTVLAFKYRDGVIVAGDRLATEGNRVASRDIQKVFPTDAHSLIAIAGAAGPATEMARLMSVELEHYEKIEGEPLELDGKANKLSQMVRANLPAAMQGLVVIPLFAGYDLRRCVGRLWKFDVTGGRYEETDLEATGSGGLYARESLKKTHRPDVDRGGALRMAVQALTDAADEDRDNSGVDEVRGIFPIIDFCSSTGIEGAADSEIEQAFRDIVAQSRRRDDS